MKTTKKIVSLLLAVITIYTFTSCTPSSQNISTSNNNSLGNNENNPNSTTAITSISEVPDGYIGIYTPEDLNSIRNDLISNYILMSDIDLSGIENWEPIGNQSSAFEGVFDGNLHTITNMSINALTSESDLYIGLFGHGNYAEFKNVRIKESHIDINEKSIIGGLIGKTVATNISNCNFSGEIIAQENSSVGGIVGFSDSANDIIKNCSNSGKLQGSIVGGIVGSSTGSIEDCYNSGTISSDSKMGGIVGEFRNGNISNCYNTGKITTANDSSRYPLYAGGIVAYCELLSNRTLVNACYNTGEIIANNSFSHAYLGGILGCGDMKYTTVSNCYNLGNLTVSTADSFKVGGIVGSSSDTIIYCYNTGKITAPDEFSEEYSGTISGSGGITCNFATVRNCFYLNNIGRAAKITGDELVNVKALKNEQMQQQASFESFDFETIWRIDTGKNNGFPYLVWQDK